MRPPRPVPSPPRPSGTGPAGGHRAPLRPAASQARTPPPATRRVLPSPPRPATLPPCPLCPVIEFPSLVRRLPSLSSRVAWAPALPPTPLHRRPEPQLPKGVLPALRRAHYANLVTTQRTIERLLSDQW